MKRTMLALVVVAAGVGAYLRFDGLGAPSYWLDEVLGQILTMEVLQQPWWRWLTGFEAEHGPLYYATQTATRLAGTSELAGRLAAALFGVATIPLAAIACVLAFRAKRRGSLDDSTTRRLDDPTTLAAIATAALLAFSPFHVYYSREARPYALVMMLTATLLVLLLRGSSLRSVTVVLVALLYTSATAAPVVAAAAVAALFTPRRRSAIAALVIACGFFLLYRQPPGETPGVPFPEWNADLFASMVRAFTVSAFGEDANGRTVLALCTLALIGAVVMFRRDRRAAMVVLSMTLLPVAFAVGALKVTGHWFALRYLGPGLIGFVVLAGAGVAAVASLLGRRRVPALGLTLLIVAAIGAQTWTVARRESFRKLDWRAITAKIEQYARPGDLVIAAEPWTGILSDYYLARQSSLVVDIQTSLVPIAEQLRSSHPATFILTTNAPGDAPMRPWVCAQPLVLASPLDGFRMHYAGDFLRERGQAAEVRASAAAIGEDVYYTQGWADVEGLGEDEFRWAIGEVAIMTVPRGNEHRTIRIRMSPLVHPSLPKQTVRIAVDGALLREGTLDAGWSEHAIEVPSGLSTITFTFGRATAPAEVDPQNGDTRRLAVAFQRPRWSAVRPPIASPPFLEENATWRLTPTRFTPAQLDRDAVLPLLGRLGFDPKTTWLRLERGELHLENLAESLAYGSDCLDDTAFVRKVCRILVNREPAPTETLRLPRARFIGRIVKSEEFRAQVLMSGASRR